MSPESVQPPEDVFKRLRHYLLFTREFDISDTWSRVFSGLEEGRVFEASKKGFSLASLKAYQEGISDDTTHFDTAYEYMFDIVTEFRGSDQDWVDHTDGFETKLPLELLVTVRHRAENEPSVVDQELLEFVDGYLESTVIEAPVTPRPVNHKEWLVGRVAVID